jgi:hypothetical protein
MKTFKSLYLLLILACTFIACEEDSEPALNTEETKASEQNALVEMMARDLDLLTYDALEDFTLNYKTSGSALTCATLSLDTTRQPTLVTIDFGPVNCQGPDGRLRRGVIEITYTGSYILPGSVITVRPVSYHVNNFGISGQRTSTNAGLNAANNLNWNIQSNLQIINPNTGDTINRQSQRNREFSAGATTLVLADNEWTITGSANGNSTAGFAWNSSIQQPLVIKNNCPHITQGKITVNPQNGRTRTIDYGNGSCDNLATISLGNRSRTITLL